MRRATICSGYAPSVRCQLLRDVFGVDPPPSEWKPEAWPDYAAPIVRPDSDGRRESVPLCGLFLSEQHSVRRPCH